MFTVYNIIFIVSIFSIYLLSKLIKKNSIPKGLKPLSGPKGWPLIGNLFSINEPIWSFLWKASKKYGPIFNCKIGGRDILVLSSNKVLTQALKEQGNNFSGRWQNVLIKNSTHDSGLLFKDGEWWAIQRSFVLRVLKDFGLGKQRSHEIVNHECSILLKEIEEGCGKVISARYLFPKSMVNVIAKLLMNMRFEREQENFKNFTKIIESLAQNRSFFSTLISMSPFMDKFPRFTRFLMMLTGRSQKSKFILSFITEIIDEHKKRFNIENEGEDLIDIFLQEQTKNENSNVKDHTFTDWQLVRICIELFIAGYETTSTTLSWSMLLLAKNADVQEKVYEEIIDIIGSDRMPSLSDKKSLVYTQAVMDEIFRFSTVVPLAITHRVFESTEIDGFFIPKNSIVFPNIYACHRDNEVWEKPFEFYPEHFLTKSDNGDIKYKPREELVPFGIGKRQCLGEALARMEFFVFLTSILQKFKVRFEKTMSKERFDAITRGTDGGIRAPLNSDVVFEVRL